MRFLVSVAALAAATVFCPVLAAPAIRAAQEDAPVVVTPGPPENSKITKDNTLNGTAPGTASVNEFSTQAVAQFPIRITNSFNGGQLYAYITGLDPQGHVVILQPNGQWYYPTSSSSTVPQKIDADINLAVGGQGSTTTYTIPSYISSGRVYISEGQLTFSALQGGNGQVTLVQPDFNNPSDSSADKNWGFIELTNNDGGLYANLSFVDFVGLPLGMTMTTSDGQSHTIRGVNSGAVGTICDRLVDYGNSENAPWAKLCQVRGDGRPLRAVAPSKYIAVNPNQFSNYYTNYVNDVWNKYSSSPLTINSQGGAGQFQCTVSGDNMNCAGGSRSFSKPSPIEIFGCQGTFGRTDRDNDVILAATPRICAAFDRTTLLLDGGNVQPSLPADRSYTTAPTNRYSQLVHQVELDGRGYAFPYDDVNPSGGVDQSGTLSSGQAASLTVTVGGA